VIEFDDVGVDFGGVTVLDDVELFVDGGEFLALVGPNGAGKTTLLRTCNGLLSPDRGDVYVGGRPVAECSAREIGQLVATVPQETTVAFEFPVADIVEMGRTPHRSRFEPADDADRAAVDDALERTDTVRFAERSVEELSGGERQRVMVARALAQDAPILLLDEPTASLDINHQVRMLALARALADDGRTVVAAIHDLELAARFCDRMALLSDGALLAEGSPETVLTSGRLEAAFDVRTAIATNPVTGTPAVTPLSDEPPGDTHVHVLGAGERAARTIGRLVDTGVSVTAGVLPEGDVAAITARGLARDVVTAPAFEPIPDDRVAAVESHVASADATVVAGSLDGPNERFVQMSSPVFALEEVPDPPIGVHAVGERDLLDRVGSMMAEPTPPQ
jgi:iron complex transport system ATP-binding protein